MEKQLSATNGDATLRKWYREYNRKLFGGRCPTESVQVSFVKRLRIGDEPRLGRCTTDMKNGCVTIRIDAGLRVMPSVAAMTLIHEMVHAFNDRWREVGRRPDAAHGRRFTAKMRELAASGAFDRLW